MLGSLFGSVKRKFVVILVVKRSPRQSERLPVTNVPENIARDVLERFFVAEPETFADRLAALTSSVDETVHDAAVTFQANLRSVVMVGSLPFKMTSAVIHRRWGHVLAAERIRALKPPGVKPEAENLAYERARKKFSNEARTSEFIDTFRDQIVLELADLSNDQAFVVAAEELLRQTVVMIWGAFEVLVGDIVLHVLNKNASLAVALISNEATRKYFSARGLVDVLAEHKGLDNGRAQSAASASGVPLSHPG
jgi:hypothetical protein